MKKTPAKPATPTPDLKHDNMEFSAATDGDDILDTDKPGYEEDAISAEELEAIADEPELEAAALVAEQTDQLADETNLPDEDWTDELPDTSNLESKSEYHRKAK